VRLVLRLHPKDYDTFLKEDRDYIERLGYEIWCDPFREPGCAIIMDIGPYMETIRRRFAEYYDNSLCERRASQR